MASIVKFVGFDYLSAGLVAEIKRNVTALIETPEGTCPGDRGYGIAQDFVGLHRSCDYDGVKGYGSF